MKQPNLKKQQKLEYKLIETEGQLEYIARLKASARFGSAVKKLEKQERRLLEEREFLVISLSGAGQRMPEDTAYLKAKKHRIILLVLLSFALLLSLILLFTSIAYSNPHFNDYHGSARYCFQHRCDCLYIADYYHDYPDALWITLSSVISAGIIAVMVLVHKFVKLCAPASKPYKEPEYLI